MEKDQKALSAFRGVFYILKEKNCRFTKEDIVDTIETLDIKGNVKINIVENEHIMKLEITIEDKSNGYAIIERVSLSLRNLKISKRSVYCINEKKD